MAKRIDMELRVKDKGSTTVKKFGSGSTAIFKKLAGPLAIGAVVASLTKLASSTIDYADKIHKLNLRLGVSTENLDKLNHVANLSGVSFDRVTKSIAFTSKIVEDAKDGLSEAERNLAKLGFTAEDFSNMSPEQIFIALHKSIQSVDDGQTRMALSGKILGDRQGELLQITGDLNKQLDAMNSNLSQDKANAAAEFKDTMTEFNRVIEQLAISFLPALSKSLIFIMQQLRIKLPKTLEEQAASVSDLDKELKSLEDAYHKMQIAAQVGLDVEEVYGETLDDVTEKISKVRLELHDAHMAQFQLNQQMKNGQSDADNLAKSLEAAAVAAEKAAEEHKNLAGEIFNYNSKMPVGKQYELYTKAYGNAYESYKSQNPTYLEKVSKTDDALKDFFSEIAEQEKSLKNAKSASEVFANSLQSNLLNSFQFIIDGTTSVEDAFKNMMLTLLKTILEQSLTGSGGAGGLGGIISSSLGGLFSGGGFDFSSSVPAAFSGYAFADGGLVTKPTLGLVGEAGTEAVIPLKNGKIPLEGGSGGDTFIINIRAIDSKSLIDLMRRNPEAVTGPLRDRIKSGDQGLRSSLKKGVQK